MGLPSDRLLMCDRTGVIYEGREDDMNQWKSAHAVRTEKRSLADALVGADVFMGLSAAGALPADLLKTMAPKPIVFAMANPDPEISPPDAKRVRPDVILPTGRSDYPHQVNNVLGFPFLHRGSLDRKGTRLNSSH